MGMEKIAVLSNVNIDMVCKLLSGKFEVLQPQGYGNAFSLMLDPDSELKRFSPKVIFFIADISELTAAAVNYEAAVRLIDQWLSSFQAGIDMTMQYFLSDTVFRTEYIEDADDMTTARIENYWLRSLQQMIARETNVHHFELKSRAVEVGKQIFFSDKLWYLGKIPFSSHGCRLIGEGISQQMETFLRTPKKVLVLDLDNTLWGGIVGELGLEGIILSDDKKGAIYRDCQRIIKQMQEHGVILAINSKNNGGDALEIIQKHPHMILKEEDFSSIQINWETKPQNMRAIARELNLGLDSFVFVDDMPGEREAVKMLLPMVEVPEFPGTLEELPSFYKEIYRRFFSKLRMTKEDSEKTQQYRDNAKRNTMESTMDYDSFLKGLNIKVETVDCDDVNRLRLEQMLQKTNQFNLTTRRYSSEALIDMQQKGWYIYLFRAADKFGDYGIIAALLVDPNDGNPKIDSFAMSCRTMGKRVENYMMDYVEKDLLKKGYSTLMAEYIPTAKNVPVKELYNSLGYKKISGEKAEELYEINLASRPNRSYSVNNE